MGQAGERIKHLRTSKGLSQENLADLWHTTQERISRIETGSVQIGADEFLDLEEFLLGVEKVGRYEFNWPKDNGKLVRV